MAPWMRPDHVAGHSSDPGDRQRRHGRLRAGAARGVAGTVRAPGEPGKRQNVGKRAQSQRPDWWMSQRQVARGPESGFLMVAKSNADG